MGSLGWLYKRRRIGSILWYRFSLDLDFEEIASALESESDLDSVSGAFEDLEEERSGKIALGTGMFAALSLQEDYGSEGDSEDA